LNPLSPRKLIFRAALMRRVHHLNRWTLVRLIAAALVHHGASISDQAPAELAEPIAELAANVPEPSVGRDSSPPPPAWPKADAVSEPIGSCLAEV
jgi:hypothetical protein